MRVLITGGAGFIGSHLADRLLERGDDLFVIDNFATGRREHLGESPRLEVMSASIADEAAVEAAFSSFAPEVVVHAAASYKDPDDWSEDSRTNVVGTANVVRAAQRRGVERLIYFQTALCYGLQPLEQPITLEHMLRPESSSYAISKTAGEYYVRLSDLDWISFRLANAYGPRNVSGPLPTFYHRLTSGKPCFVMDTRRDFVFVDDVVELVLMTVDGGGRRGVYHVSSGRDVSIKELFELVVAAIGVSLEEDDVELRPRNPEDAPTIHLDPSKTERDFGWRTRTPLEVGIAATIDYYRTHGIEQTFTHLRLAERT